MCFYGTLGYVQIASDFRIVTALKQQIDDLLLPVPHLTDLLFHAMHLKGCARSTAIDKSAVSSGARS